MALTSEITVSSAIAVPSGYTSPSITLSLTNPSERSFTYEFDASGVAHASNETTGITAAVAAVKTYVDGTLLPTTMKVDISGQTVEAVITINSITRKYADGIYLTADKYVVSGVVNWA